MFVLLKRTAKEHLKTFISRGGVSFFGVQGMFVNVISDSYLWGVQR
jgi:hypothetical protein